MNTIEIFNRAKLKILRNNIDEFLYGEIIYHAKYLLYYPKKLSIYIN